MDVEYETIEKYFGKTITQKIHSHMNGIEDQPLCTVCDTNPVEFLGYKLGYRENCSIQCSGKNENRIVKLLANRDYDTITKKMASTSMEKYGTKTYLQTEEFKDKSKTTKLKRYGNENYNASEKNLTHIPIDYAAHEHFTNKRTYVEIAGEFGVGEPTVSKKMREAGYHGRRHSQQSSHEREIIKFLNCDVEENSRSVIPDVELDIFIPEYNLAIELNGLYWHHDQRKPKHHIHKKYQIARDNGISLLNIWDIEWTRKQELVKSIINGRLQRHEKIDARKCSIIELNVEQEKTFLNENHIQGYVPSAKAIGLIHDDIIYSIMTWSKSRFGGNKTELLRFCNRMNTNVRGAASKLFRHANLDDVVSYSDNRLFEGGVYEKLGFKFSHESKPNYWYFRNNEFALRSRVQFQKHKLPNLLENFDSNFSEYENMKNNGWLRIFDCGNKVYEYRRT